MKKYELMDQLIKDNNGYLFAKDVENAGISRTSLANYVKKHGLTKISKGTYISSDTWEDNLYILQLRYPKIVFSDETALYLNGLIDREYSNVCITVPPDFSRGRLSREGIIVHQDRNYLLGITEIKTNFGNPVKTYNKERCICNMVKRRKDMDVQHYQTALKTYMRLTDKNLNRLMLYAEKTGVMDKIRRYTEVLL